MVSPKYEMGDIVYVNWFGSIFKGVIKRVSNIHVYNPNVINRKDAENIISGNPVEYDPELSCYGECYEIYLFKVSDGSYYDSSSFAENKIAYTFEEISKTLVS